MASTQVISAALAVLSLMKAGNEEAWTKERRTYYAEAMLNWSNDLCHQAVQWCADNLDWRPSRAELRKVATRIASPTPSAADSYSEIIHWAQERGVFARRDAENPNVFLEGAPDDLHPITQRHIAALGGWEYVCSGAANLEGGIRKAIHGQHDLMEQEWQRDVSAQLQLPSGERNPRYFPKWSMPEIVEREEVTIKQLSAMNETTREADAALLTSIAPRFKPKELVE